MRKFVLIDGNAILHRAYHALPPLTNKNGEPTQAVYGFFTMFLTILQDMRPDFIAVCFDRPKPTFRQTLYAGYHANRPQLASDFVPQIVKVHELLEAMKVSIFEIDGYEADDMIGTIANKVKSEVKNSEEKIETIIVTGDRDMLQLVNDSTRVLMPITGLTKTQLFDEAKVVEKYGVHPLQFVDYKALIGDQSDWYPGVSGIGPKTAASLLQKYDTFEKLYEQVGELPEKIGMRLATDAEQAALAKKLATIVTDAPVQFDCDSCAVSLLDINGLRKGFEAIGSNTLLKRLDAQFGIKTAISNRQKEKKDSRQLDLL